MVYINEITHEYKGGFRLQIEKLHLPPNSIIGLVGENGSGKTTLMSVLSGYLKANGVFDIQFSHEASNILFIPSDMELYDFLTVEELLRLVQKYSSEELDIGILLEKLDMADKAACSIDELSLGMKKKLTLLPLFIKPYDLVILDEPFNSIDLGYIFKLKELLKEQKQHTTILLSSHILETLVDLCDLFVLISEGRVKKVFQNDGNLRQVEGEIFDRSN